MKTILLSLFFFLTTTTTAYASSVTTIDGDIIGSADRTKLWTMPSATDTIVGRASSDSLSNKTLVAPVLSGTVTGTYTLGGTPSFSSALSVANGGTGASTLTANNVLLGNGTSAVQFVAPGSSGNILTSNGTTWTSAAPAGSPPAINGGSGSPQSVTAGGGVSLSGIVYENYKWIAGNAGAVTVTATPSVTACTADGQSLKIIGTSNTNTVKLQDQASLASSGLSLNGDWVGSKDRVLTLHCDITQGLWVEDSRR